MNGTKLLVSVVAALTLAGCDSGGGGGGTTSPSASEPAPVGPPTGLVTSDLVSAACLQSDGTFRVYGTCVVHVADPKGSKVLVLRSDRTFQVAVPPPGTSEHSAKQRAQLRADGVAQVTIPVVRRTDVLISCVGAAVCSVSLGDSLSDLSG